MGRRGATGPVGVRGRPGLIGSAGEKGHKGKIGPKVIVSPFLILKLQIDGPSMQNKLT